MRWLYAWWFRPPSARAIRHAWLTDVHAELVLGRGIRVDHNAVAMLMQRAGIVGRSGARKRYGIPSVASADDLVDRMFVRERPNQLWVTDITEHPTREGKVYCAVVLDAFSRRVVGWSISHNPTASLTTNALGMAIEHCDAQRGETALLRQRDDRGVLVADAGRALGHAPLADTRRARERDLRVHRDLPQPTTPAG